MTTDPPNPPPEDDDLPGSGLEEYESLFDQKPPDYIEERNYLLKDIPYETVRQAWFTLSHLLIEPGSKIVHMGCGDGDLTYAMAVLRPSMKLVGVDKSKRSMNKAREKYKLHNLEFKHGDVSSDLFPPGTIDVIINSFILHIVFSNARYNERIVSDTLRKHFHMLKNNGVMFIRDYARPPPHHYILMEMHDEDSDGEDIAELSEADLLVWYSEHARPKQDPGCGGFFLEELPPRFPRTRLFRLPFKWAYEFVMRKDSRDNWQHHLPYEYTYFTVEEFRRELRVLGSRVEYSGPHWDENFITKNFDGHFRLYDNDGNPMGDPATSFIAIARKMPERESLVIMERRISEDKGPLEIKALRNERTGELVDIVTRSLEIAEVIPYRVTEDGRLNVYLHDGIVRGIVNAVPRAGLNIDGRQWSGHMVEPISIEYRYLNELGTLTAPKTKKFAREYIGLKPKAGSVITRGAEYYPDPNYIDERVHTYYLEVDEGPHSIPPKNKIFHNTQFRAKSTIREIGAQQILDAVSVGLIPNGRLELQILALFQHLNMKAENWTSKDISMIAGEIVSTLDVKEFLKQAAESDKRFREVKGAVGQLRTVNSIFVEEGQSQGGRAGLTSDLADFVISDEKTINTAVVVPLTKSLKGDIHAGFTIKHTPVPERYEGKGMTVSAPQFNIPKEITNYKMLKQFIAEKFGVTPDMVIKLGESYYSHAGITPEKIHPFCIIAPPAYLKDPEIKFMPIYQYMLLWRSISREPHFMTTIARAYRFLPGHMRTKAKFDVLKILEDRFKQAQPDWTVPASFEPATPQAFKSAGVSFHERASEEMKMHQAAGTAAGKSKGDKEEKKKPKQRNTDVSALYGKDKPSDYYSKKEQEKKEKKERAKRLSQKKGVFLTEPKEAKFDADTEGLSEEQSKDLDVDITNDDVYIVHEEELVDLIEGLTEEDLKAAEEAIGDRGSGGKENDDFDPDDYELDEHDLEEPDPEDISLIKEFEKEIKAIKDALDDEDDDPEPKPS
ncbi:MAG: methyltransferase domain-containing protein [Rhodospirillales bacterium]|nr:methyltransferase domain-containing protein [Alphaproteobacteria bacterium]MCB1839117.1 methyltransferase domain-containing protein [Alphaproteobacteria bacterium]MCB9976153.1 methyltransferase domain-containing protein [Rhodospirillales bacterium]